MYQQKTVHNIENFTNFNIPKLGPILEYYAFVKFEYYVDFIQYDQINKWESREENPQSTTLPFHLGHLEKPLNCLFKSKTIDTHLLHKQLEQLVILDKILSTYSTNP